MGGWRRRFSRPVMWLLGGLVAGAVGAGMAVLAVDTAAKIPGIDELPPCRTDFAGDCVTVRNAIVVGDGYYYHAGRTNSWPVDVKRWRLRLEELGPRGEHNVRVDLRNQAGRQRLIRGALVTITYVTKDVAWVELSDGTTLTTEEHPRYAAPMLAALALFAGGMGASLAQTAIRVARRRGSWLGRADLHLEPNIGLLIAAAGILGFGLLFLLPRPAPLAIFISLVLMFAAIRVLPILWRRQPQAGRHAARRPGRDAATKGRR